MLVRLMWLFDLETTSWLAEEISVISLHANCACQRYIYSRLVFETGIKYVVIDHLFGIARSV